MELGPIRIVGRDEAEALTQAQWSATRMAMNLAANDRYEAAAVVCASVGLKLRASVPQQAPAGAHRCSTPEELAFATMFGVPAHLGAILARLHAGETVKAHRRQISELRSALDPEAIDTDPDGYRLTPQGAEECRAALAGFSQWIARKAL